MVVMAQQQVNKFWEATTLEGMVTTFEAIPKQYKVSVLFYLMRTEKAFNSFFKDQFLVLLSTHRLKYQEFSSAFLNFYFKVSGVKSVIVNMFCLNMDYVQRVFPIDTKNSKANQKKEEAKQKAFISDFNSWYYTIESTAFTRKHFELTKENMAYFLYDLKRAQAIYETVFIIQHQN